MSALIALLEREKLGVLSVNEQIYDKKNFLHLCGLAAIVNELPPFIF